MYRLQVFKNDKLAFTVETTTVKELYSTFYLLVDVLPSEYKIEKQYGV